MFMTLGSTLFVDKSGSRVRPSLIRELYGQVHQYAWGAATLAYLYHELGLASRKKCKKLAGCLTLLQAWIYEYFPAFRPHRGENTLRDGEPRCRKWIVRQESKRHNQLVMFRCRLDRMTSDEVMWLPYGAREVELHLRTLFTGCIVYHDYVRPPARNVPPPRIPRPLRVCRTADPNKHMLKFAEGLAEEQWDGFPYMNALNHTLLQFCSYNGIIHRDYLPWYMKHSHPYVVHDRDYVPPAGPDVTLLEHWLARLFDKLNILFNQY